MKQSNARVSSRSAADCKHGCGNRESPVSHQEKKQFQGGGLIKMLALQLKWLYSWLQLLQF